MLRPPAARHPLAAYGLALALVAAGFAARLALTPLFGTNHSYTAFYPVVILAAYFLGARPAILAALLSAALAYWFFAAPEMGWKSDFTALASMMFFGFTASVSIYFITGMARALGELAEARGRAEALARSHAELFGALNDRVTNHLQLVAAVLQLQARDESDQSVSRALAEASARTLLISRVHRDVAGEADKTLDFDAFARQLTDATLAARGHPSVEVEIDRQGLQLPVDQATSVAMVLLECLNARLQADTPATLRVRLSGDEREATLEVSERWDGAGAPVEPDLERHLIAAMVEQLGGRFSFTSYGVMARSALVFPRPHPLPAGVPWSAGRPSLH